MKDVARASHEFIARQNTSGEDKWAESEAAAGHLNLSSLACQTSTFSPYAYELISIRKSRSGERERELWAYLAVLNRPLYSRVGCKKCDIDRP